MPSHVGRHAFTIFIFDACRHAGFRHYRCWLDALASLWADVCRFSFMSPFHADRYAPIAD